MGEHRVPVRSIRGRRLRNGLSRENTERNVERRQDQWAANDRRRGSLPRLPRLVRLILFLRLREHRAYLFHNRGQTLGIFVVTLAECRPEALCHGSKLSVDSVLCRISLERLRRVAISNRRLLSLAEGRVTFEWKDYASGNQIRTMTLKVVEFTRRFLLHVLPSGFVHIGHFGFVANRYRKEKLALCRSLLTASQSEQTPAPVLASTVRR